MYSQDDTSALMAATATLRPALHAATHKCPIGLVTVTGVRLGEAIRLGLADLDAVGEVLTIRDGKFAKSRHVAATSTFAAQARVRAAPRSALPRPGTSALLVSHRRDSLGGALHCSPASATPALTLVAYRPAGYGAIQPKAGAGFPYPNVVAMLSLLRLGSAAEGRVGASAASVDPLYDARPLMLICATELKLTGQALLRDEPRGTREGWVVGVFSRATDSSSAHSRRHGGRCNIQACKLY